MRISQYFLIENTFQKNKIQIKDRFFIITEEKKSTLKKIQENKEMHRMIKEIHNKILSDR